MSASHLSLDSFNCQILACQDEAYALANCLVQDEQAACALLQEVVLMVYAGWRGRIDDLGIRVLRGVIRQARRQAGINGASPDDWQPQGWQQLECCEQETLLLVDVLGKSYREAACIIGRSEREVARLIAKGRRRLLANRACLPIEVVK